jgi:hypothetical protein
LSFYVNSKDVLDGIAAMRQAGADLSPVFRSFRRIIRADIEEHFARRDGTDGAWPAYATSTVDRLKARKGGTFKSGKRAGQATRKTAARMANMLGRLKTAWKEVVTRTYLEFRNLVPWSAAHDEGDVIAHGRQLPARPYAYLSDDIPELFADSLEFHLVGRW